MNDVTAIRIATYWLSNPSIIWLPFALPFFLGIWGVAVGVTLLILIVWQWRGVQHSWSPLLFLPLLLLLMSTGASYLWFPQWVPEWQLLAIALSAGWLWRIEYILSEDSPIGIDHWLFSARLFGLGSLVFLFLVLLFPINSTWLPGLLTMGGVLYHVIRGGEPIGKSRFSCPVSSPLVRMAIVKGDQIWLTDRPFTGCYVEGAESGCYAPSYRDHPLTSCVGPEETPEETLTRAFAATGLHCSSTPHFLLKYQHPTCSGQNRTIYLFVMNIKLDKCVDELNLRGHFYTPKQIERRLKEGRFSPLFVDEYTYLRNTLIKVNLLKI